jgi:UDP-GlcNAc:undecaprenyl-phosphate GlcNAc-1-phosphate transferase
MDLLLGFLLSMSVTMALIPPLMRVAPRLQFLDAPGERKVHASPVPRVGGIAMAAGMLLALGLSGQFSQPMPAYVCGVLVLLAFGVWDDRVTLGPIAKVTGQLIAVAVVVAWGGVEISTLTLTERFPLPPFVGVPLTILFLLGVTNAINLADGLDGLAGGTTLLSLSALALLATNSGVTFVSVVAIVIIGSILGFLRFNTHPARVFMGDGGSQILGFSAGVAAIVLTQERTMPFSSALPLLLLGIPIMDTLMVMTQRMLAGRSPFHADRNHVHHRLLSLGFDHHEAVIAIYVLQASLFVTAWFLRYESDLTIAAAFAGFSILTIGLMHLAARRGWRWRALVAPEARAPSAIGRTIAWLRAPQHLPRFCQWTIALAIVVYFVCVSFVIRTPDLDVRIIAALLLACVAGALVLRWQRAEASWAEKIALYVTVVMAVYFDGATETFLEHEAVLQWTVFSILVVAIVLSFRFATDRRFRLTPLDVLVLFAAVVVPNLPGSMLQLMIPRDSVAKLIALMYGVESLFEAGPRLWRVPCLAALILLSACVLRSSV